MSGDRAIAYGACAGWPCPIEAVDLRTGTRSSIVAAAGPAALAGRDGRLLAYARDDGALEVLDLVTLQGQTVPDAAGSAPVRGGSAATGGADGTPGALLVAIDGLFADPGAARWLDPQTLALTTLVEVQR
jgi:hypothetical protein